MKHIEILGGGCAKCDTLKKETEIAAQNLGIEVKIEKVDDFAKIAKYEVMVTPALVIDGELQFSGKVLKAQELEPYLRRDKNEF